MKGKLLFIGLAVFAGSLTPPLAFAVTGRYLNESENPRFSCVAIFQNDEGLRNICSGEFIGKKKFLTAGHCNDEGFDRILIGCEHNNSVISVTDVHRHPEYSRSGDPYDQMILTIKPDFPFAPVSLPQNQSEIERLIKKEDCAIFGYGLDNNNSFGKLRGVLAEFNYANFGPSMTSLGGGSNQPRQGDSGAGLLCREDSDSPWIRIGTISQAESGLANAALLSHSLNWILEQ